jgi:hypothetical protein
MSIMWQRSASTTAEGRVDVGHHHQCGGCFLITSFPLVAKRAIWYNGSGLKSIPACTTRSADLHGERLRSWVVAFAAVLEVILKSGVHC